MFYVQSSIELLYTINQYYYVQPKPARKPLPALPERQTRTKPPKLPSLPPAISQDSMDEDYLEPSHDEPAQEPVRKVAHRFTLVSLIYMPVLTY